LQKIKHHNIISIIDVIDTPRHLYIILEFANDGELFEKICDKGYYAEAEAKDVCKQILHAVSYLHERNITHRDLKPENILLDTRDGESTIKVTDFGLARLIGEAEIATTLCGTPMYVAPEVLLHGLNIQGDPSASSAQHGYGKEVDMWSLGCILYVLLSGRPPFDCVNSMGLWEKIRLGQYDFAGDRWARISAAAKDLISKMLIVDPSKRYTVKQALQHPWFVKHKNLPTPEKSLPRSMSEIPSSLRIVDKEPPKVAPNSGKKVKPTIRRSPPRLRQPYPEDEDESSPADSRSPEFMSLEGGLETTVDETLNKPSKTPLSPSANIASPPQASVLPNVNSPLKAKHRPLSMNKADKSDNKPNNGRKHSSNRNVDSPDMHLHSPENRKNATPNSLRSNNSHLKLAVPMSPTKEKVRSTNTSSDDSSGFLKAGRDEGALRASSFRRTTRSSTNKRPSVDKPPAPTSAIASPKKSLPTKASFMDISPGVYSTDSASPTAPSVIDMISDGSQNGSDSNSKQYKVIHISDSDSESGKQNKKPKKSTEDDHDASDTPRRARLKRLKKKSGS
jgi:serine/threonine protein kinase